MVELALSEIQVAKYVKEEGVSGVRTGRL